MAELNTGNPLLDIFILIAMPAFIGSFASDYIKTLKGKYLTVKAGRILASGAFASFFSYSVLCGLFIDKGYTNALMFTSFAIGLIAFELVQHMVSLEGWLSLVKKLQKIATPVFEIISVFYEIKKGYKSFERETVGDKKEQKTEAVESSDKSYDGGVNHDI